jgi:purine-binding chemotaxis protein CheW
MESLSEKTANAASTERPRIEETPETQDNVLSADQMSKAEFRMIAFSLAGRDYGIDIMKVKEISHEGKFTYVPNTAPYVLGVHNLRGEIIPIIDLRRMFNLPVSEARTGADQNVLILKLEKFVLGVVVDSIDGVMNTPVDMVQPPHPIFSDINIQYISGIVEKEGRLSIILDVERIFQESAPAPKQATRYEKPPEAAVGPMGAQEFHFVSEGLATFASFFVTSVNLSWAEKRFETWRKEREKAGLSVQLGGAEDAREFLDDFSSAGRGDLWGDSLRVGFLSLLPSHLTGTFIVWNHGCGRGFDAYSVVCALKASFPMLTVKAWANDGNLVEIASAPSLALPVERVPSFFRDGGFVRDTGSGWQFSPAVRESIIFEYTESLSRTESMQADLIVCRDMLSSLRPETQKTTLEAFWESLKPGGLLILGANEQVEGEGWRKREKGGLRAFQREGRKE